MDWIQVPFEVDAILHHGVNPPVVRQRWMFTHLPFLALGTNCVMGNRIWNGDTATVYDVGMFPPASANYVQDARWVLPKNFHPTHICNPEWLSTGEPWPNDLPPTLYDDYQIPLCCGAINRVVEGGYQFGGAVRHPPYYVDSTAGGYQWGGSVVRVSDYARATLGGYQWGGQVVRVSGYQNATLGGYQWGGSVVRVSSFTRATFGGYSIGGAVRHPPYYVDSTAGGYHFGGSVVRASSFARATLGGYAFGGEVSRPQTYIDATYGGVEVGGAAGDVYPGATGDHGGVEVGGEAGDVFT